MKTIKSVYKIGNGPSSSHTVGPFRAAKIFLERHPDADAWRVMLYGSLAYTGEGHGTGKAIKAVLPGAEVVFDREARDLPHPNTMRFEAFKQGQLIGSNRIFSIGGGSIRVENETSDDELEVYPQKNFGEILSRCNEDGITLVQFIDRMEGTALRDCLKTVWRAMQDAVERGLAADMNTAIKTYLSGVPGRDRIEAQTAINAIRASGGIAVWAHPLGGEGERRLTDGEFEARLESLLAMGIQGLECLYSRYTRTESGLLLSHARSHGLIVTGGSDYHGLNKTGLELGMLNAEQAPADIDWQGLSDVLTDATNMV
jgi:hypothetical protein